MRKAREAGKKLNGDKTAGRRNGSERGGETSEGKVKRQGDERERRRGGRRRKEEGGMSVMFEDEQCPSVTLAPRSPSPRLPD